MADQKNVNNYYCSCGGITSQHWTVSNNIRLLRIVNVLFSSLSLPYVCTITFIWMIRGIRGIIIIIKLHLISRIKILSREPYLLRQNPTRELKYLLRKFKKKKNIYRCVICNILLYVCVCILRAVLSRASSNIIFRWKS